MITKEAAETAVGGGEGIRRMLGRIDVDAELKKEEERIKKLKGAELNRANKKIRVLRNLKNLGLRPDDAFLLRNLPVIPPKYRPIYPDQSGAMIEDPINHVYKNTWLVNDALRSSKQLPLEEDRINARDKLHEALRVFQGWAEPTGYRKEMLRGIFDLIASKGQPKGGYFQSKLLTKRQDVSGRSTIVLNPDLHMDQAGIPEKMAWKIFEPFTIQDLVSSGYTVLEAVRMNKDRDPRAEAALRRVAEQRPVLLNRAPSLHKHSVLAFRPTLVKGLSIELPPLVVKGFNADFDGDTMSVEVPVTRDAVEEAMGLLPSKNMLSTSGKILTAPDQSAQLGLYLLTREGKKTGKVYASDQDAIVAHKQGEIQSDDVVEVDGVPTTVGRILVNQILPSKLQDRGIVLDKKRTGKILETLARNSPQEAPAVAEKLKDLGFRSAYDHGFSIRLSDFQVNRKVRDPIVRKIRNQVDRIRDSKLPDAEKEKEIESALLKGQAELQGAVAATADDRNNLVTMVRAGARGNWGQMLQMNAAPIAVEDPLGKTVPALIESSYSEGLTPAEYWTSMHGARKGMIERTLQTREPGKLNKSLVHTAINYPITIEDCGTANGIEMDASSQEVVDRYLAADAEKVGKQGEVVTPALADRIMKAGIRKVRVRSPITCEAPKGICSTCVGMDEYGQAYPIGTSIGTISAQSVSEPMTQLTMTTFHTGGVASGEDRIVDAFSRVENLLTLPEKVPDKATLAERTGKVESIAAAPIGGWNVLVDGKNHHVPPERKILVKQNEAVEKGTRISSGNRDPKDVLRLQGVLNMRSALVEDLAAVYRKAGPYVKQKHFETVVRAVTEGARVRDGGPSDWVPGDFIPWNLARSINSKKSKMVSVDNALGTWLHDEQDGVPADKILDETDIEALRKAGVTKVRVNPDPIDVDPVVKGVNTIPLTRRDWISQLAFRGLKPAMKGGIAEGWRSNLHDTNPIPGIVYGAEFGMGKFAEDVDGDLEALLTRHLSDARGDL